MNTFEIDVRCVHCLLRWYVNFHNFSLLCFLQIWDGKWYKVIHEVYLMVRAAGGPKSSGKSAVITLLDCFDLEDYLILVMEKPRHSSDLYEYRTEKGDRLTEEEAKVLKL